MSLHFQRQTAHHRGMDVRLALGVALACWACEAARPPAIPTVVDRAVPDAHVQDAVVDAQADSGMERADTRMPDARPVDAQVPDAMRDADPPDSLVDAAPPDAGPPQRWRLVWADEFDGPAGPLDPAKWTHDVGGDGWGNDQLEFDTDRLTNSAVDGAGHLIITAREEAFGGRRYTSARILTRDRFARRYGRFEARIQLPRGQGIWPAFWMLGANIGNVGWPQCGEIDIMEFRGQNERECTVALHGPGYSGGNPLGAVAPSDTPLPDDFHVFAVEWAPERIQWFVDDRQVFEATPADIPPGTRWVYDHPFFIILNVAVGGRFLGNPDATTQFPQQMRVDYVRVWEDTQLDVPDPPANPLAPDGENQRLSLGLFLEEQADRFVSIDNERTHFWIYENTVQLADDADAVEGQGSHRLIHAGGQWWGAGIHWNDARDLSDWTTLHISLKANDPGFEGLQLRINSAGNRSGAVDVRAFGFCADGAWHSLAIPLAAFEGADLSAVVAPLVFGGGGAVAGAALKVDAVYWSNR
jgi:beta-glucanase (GH16 family)